MIEEFKILIILQKMIEELKKKYPVEFAAKTAPTAEEQMLLKLKGTSVTPLYQYVQEEGAADNRIHTVQCTVSTLTVEVRIFPYYL